jgi:hypothetical protein
MPLVLGRLCRTLRRGRSGFGAKKQHWSYVGAVWVGVSLVPSGVGGTIVLTMIAR